jgi:hypothetical protein
VSEQPSALTMAAIRMAQHILEARRARAAAEEAERRRTMQLVKSDSERRGMTSRGDRNG